MEDVEFHEFIDKIPEDILKGVVELSETVFGKVHTDLFLQQLNDKKNVLLDVAIEASKLVGYKIGHDRKPDHFYSWLGAVDKNHWGRGIASQLMTMQHEWCQKNGYRSVRTHTKNKWRNMIVLNLRHGFDIIGTFTDDKGEPKIIMQKNFTL